MSTFEGELPIKIGVIKSESTLSAAVRWLEYCVSDDCLILAGGLYESGKNRKAMRTLARRVIDEEVLSINENADRTGRLRRSFTATHGSSNRQILASLIVYSDPSVAKTKGPIRGNKARLSYAAFFERPEFNTFIRRDLSRTDEMRYRPFMDPLVEAVQVHGTEAFAKAYISAIKSRMPKRLLEPFP